MEASFARYVRELQDTIVERQKATAGKLDASFGSIHTDMSQSFTRLEEMIDRSHELHDIPQGDTPTMEEMIELAKSDPVIRKRIENTLTELEFEDPLVGFN